MTGEVTLSTEAGWQPALHTPVATICMNNSQEDGEDGRSATTTSTPVVFLLSPPLKPVGRKVNLLDLAAVSNPMGV